MAKQTLPRQETTTPGKGRANHADSGFSLPESTTKIAEAIVMHHEAL